MKQKAFTLAEILVVVGIIGVVSMITLPNLTQGTSNTETIAKVKQFDADLQNALALVTDKYGENALNLSTSTAVGERLLQYFNVSKTCGVATGQGCFASSNVTAVSGTNSRSSLDSDSTIYKIILKDGSSVAVYRFNGNSLTMPSNYLLVMLVDYGGYIYFDVDGPRKGLNKFGSDIFRFVYTQNGLYRVSPRDFASGVVSSYCKTTVSYNYCTDWILNFGNMEYMDCDNLTYDNITCD